MTRQVKDWHVLVSKRRLLLGVSTTSGKSKFLKQDFFVPIVPLQNTSANCLWEGVFASSVARPTEDLVRTVLDSADLPVAVVESDGAYSNDKMVWHYLNNLPPRFVKTFRLCGNHAVHLVEAAMFSAGKDLRMLGNIYDASKVTPGLTTYPNVLLRLHFLRPALASYLIGISPPHRYPARNI